MNDNIFIFDESGTILEGVKDRTIKSVTIPDGVTCIGDKAFKGCSSLTSVTIPNSVKSIGRAAFSGCTAVISVDIPDSVTSIGDQAFSDCSSLTTIKVDVNNPKYDSRNNCNAIIETSSSTLISGCKNTTIPNNVTIIGGYSFSGCINLTSIEIPNSVKSIKEYAFLLCLNLTSVSIPDSVKNIGYFAFFGCSLTSVTIPSSVTSIGDSAFSGCLRLISIMVDIANPNYDSRNKCNAIIETSSNKLILGCKNTSIPNKVTSIADGAFLSCPGLISITIPNSVKSIGWSAFRNCTGLTTIDIPNSVKSIGSNAFSYCSSLSSITIGNSVTSIGDEAFSNCSSLTSITISNSVTNIGNRVFFRCSNLNTISISDSVISLGESIFEDCSRLTSISIPNSVTTIERGAFSGCKRLTSVFIPNSVTSIGAMAFWGCPINRVYLNKETKYENNSFDKCTEVIKRRVFISYSWDDDEHKAWVKKLATDLNKYVYVIFDQWDLRGGNDKNQFMEQSVSQSDKVLCILTPNYKQKCDKRQGGSGFEFSLISAEIVQKNPPSKFIPILRSGNFVNSSPIALGPRFGFDFSSNDPETYKKMLEKLLSEIKEESLRPD